jgi:glucose/arabinose dehydrogenase
LIARSGVAFFSAGNCSTVYTWSWKSNKVIGEEPLLLEPDVRARIRDVRFGPDGMLYVLTDSNPQATAKLLKITSKK